MQLYLNGLKVKSKVSRNCVTAQHSKLGTLLNKQEQGVKKVCLHQQGAAATKPSRFVPNNNLRDLSSDSLKQDEIILFSVSKKLKTAHSSRLQTSLEFINNQRKMGSLSPKLPLVLKSPRLRLPQDSLKHPSPSSRFKSKYALAKSPKADTVKLIKPTAFLRREKGIVKARYL